MYFYGCLVHNVYIQYPWGLCISQILQVLCISHMIFGSKRAVIWYHKQSLLNGLNLDGALLGLSLTTQSQNPSVFPRMLPAHPIHSHQLHLIKRVFSEICITNLLSTWSNLHLNSNTTRWIFFKSLYCCRHFWKLRISCKKESKIK